MGWRFFLFFTFSYHNVKALATEMRLIRIYIIIVIIIIIIIIIIIFKSNCGLWYVSPFC